MLRLRAEHLRDGHVRRLHISSPTQQRRLTPAAATKIPIPRYAMRSVRSANLKRAGMLPPAEIRQAAVSTVR